MIELQGVNKTYPSKTGEVSALQNIDLSVGSGEICGVIGRSGAGKSTLIRCVNLLERPTSGSIKIGGTELTTLSTAALRKVRHQIGMVFQHFNLLSSRTVFDNIALPLELLKKSKAEIHQTVMPLLELIGLRDRQNAYPAQLSGGQKQRVAIARALATQPNVLLCDEMTSALDPETTDSILQLIKDINTQMGLSILLITHEMGVIKSIADHVAVLDQGRIIENTDVVNLFKNPQTEVAKTFTQSILKGDLPDSIINQLQSQSSDNDLAIVRIAFVGETATQPVIDGLVKRCHIDVNILQANLEFLHRETIGVMFVGIQGNVSAVNEALNDLQEHGVTAEVLGYVRADVLGVTQRDLADV